MGKVCDFQFADLRHQGTLSLVVSDDGGGESDCNDVDIFDKAPRGLEDRELDAGFAYLDGVENINGGGRFGVIVEVLAARENVGDYYGKGTSPYCNACVTCTEYWPRIYAWTGSGYTEVSPQYPKYYKREMISLKKQIAAIDAANAAARLSIPAVPVPMQASPAAFKIERPLAIEASESPRIEARLQQQPLEPSGAGSPSLGAEEPPDPSELDCLKAEAAKIERLTGTSRDAGMSDAIEWANSHDPAQRDFATGVLSDIGTAEALKYEQTLSRDSDPDVAKSAKSELESWGKAGRPDTFLESTVQIKPKATDKGAK